MKKPKIVLYVREIYEDIYNLIDVLREIRIRDIRMAVSIILEEIRQAIQNVWNWLVRTYVDITLGRKKIRIVLQ